MTDLHVDIIGYLTDANILTININGKEYEGYVSPYLFNKFDYMLTKSPGKALTFLKKYCKLEKKKVNEIRQAKLSTILQHVTEPKNKLIPGNVWVITRDKQIIQVSKQEFEQNKDKYKDGPFYNYGMTMNYLNEEKYDWKKKLSKGTKVKLITRKHRHFTTVSGTVVSDKDGKLIIKGKDGKIYPRKNPQRITLVEKDLSLLKILKSIENE